MLSRRARKDARARDVQDVGAAAVGARVGRIDVAARVAATYALRVSVRVAVLGRRARRDTRPRQVQDVRAAAVGACVGRADVAARVAARCALRVCVHDAVLGREAPRDARPATSKMQMLLLSVQVLDGQTSQLASLQDEPCRSVPRRRTRSQGTQRRTSSPRPRCRSCCSRYTGWTHRSRSSRRCKMSTAGQCPRRRTRSQGTQRRSSRHVQDAGAAAVGPVDGQTSQLASLQDEPWRSVSTTPYSAAGHAKTYVPAASKM